MSGTLSKVVSNVAVIVTTLVALFTMSWKLALVGLAVLPLLIAPTRSAGRARLKYATQTQAKTDVMNQVINETLSASGSLLVKMFTREQLEFEKFDRANPIVSPEGAKPGDMHIVGFYDEGSLVAVLDLICGYPQDDAAFIGWFMVDADLQRRGVGSQIFADVRAAMQAQGYHRLQVACPEASEPSLAFWRAQGFEASGRRDDAGEYPVVYLSRNI